MIMLSNYYCSSQIIQTYFTELELSQYLARKQ